MYGPVTILLSGLLPLALLFFLISQFFRPAAYWRSLGGGAFAGWLLGIWLAGLVAWIATAFGAFDLCFSLSVKKCSPFFEMIVLPALIFLGPIIALVLTIRLTYLFLNTPTSDVNK